MQLRRRHSSSNASDVLAALFIAIVEEMRRPTSTPTLREGVVKATLTDGCIAEFIGTVLGNMVASRVRRQGKTKAGCIFLQDNEVTKSWK